MNYAEADPISRSHLVLFEQTLRDLGWIDGQNLRIDYRWSAGDADLAHTYAAELAGLSTDVILAFQDFSCSVGFARKAAAGRWWEGTVRRSPPAGYADATTWRQLGRSRQ